MDTLTRRKYVTERTVRPQTAVEPVSIRAFCPGAGRKVTSRFVDLGARLQGATPGRLVSDRACIAARLQPDFFFHRYGEAMHFIASRGGIDLGRVSAMVNSRAVDEHGAQVGYVGMYECVDDEAISCALLDSAVSWLRDRGCASIVGPVDFSTWYAYRNCLGPFDRSSLLMEPFTPAHYDEQWRAFGFREAHTYFTAEIDDVQRMVDYARPKLADALAAGFRFEIMDPARWEESLRGVYDLSIAEFAENVRYTHVDFDEFSAMYADLGRSLDPRFLIFAIAPGGEVAGYVFSIPNFAAALQALDGRADLRHRLRALLAKRHADSVIVKTVAVSGRYRSYGLGTVLVGRAHQTALDLGYRRVHHALMHETNHSRRISENGGGKICRRYALYELAPGTDGSAQ